MANKHKVVVRKAKKASAVKHYAKKAGAALLSISKNGYVKKIGIAAAVGGLTVAVIEAAGAQRPSLVSKLSMGGKVNGAAVAAIGLGSAAALLLPAGKMTSYLKLGGVVAALVGAAMVVRDLSKSSVTPVLAKVIPAELPSSVPAGAVAGLGYAELPPPSESGRMGAIEGSARAG
jgi:hypothetical protein